MPGEQYECRDCGRAFRVYEDEKKGPKCPSCESENIAPRQPLTTLPSWVSFEPAKPGSG